MASLQDDYENTDTYEMIDKVCEPDCYTNLTSIERDETVNKTRTLSASGHSSTARCHLGNTGNREELGRIPSRVSTDSPKWKVILCVLVLFSMMFGYLVASNVYLTLEINKLGSNDKMEIPSNNETLVPSGLTPTVKSTTIPEGPKARNGGSDSDTSRTNTLELYSTAVTSFVKPTPCPDGWIQRQSSCYFFETKREPWRVAVNNCSGLTSHLVAIESVGEFDFIVAELVKMDIGNLTQYWSGGNDIEVEGSWVWTSTRNNVTIQRWQPNEPNSDSGGEDCMSIKNINEVYLFNDHACDDSFGFVCEMGGI